MITEHKQRKYASVWLEQDSTIKPHALFCMNCQCPLLVYQGNVAKVVAGDASSVMSFPLEVRCKGNSQIYGRCPYMWVVQGFLT